MDGDDVYVAPMNGKVYQVDVTNPNAARLTAVIPTGGGACDVAIAGDVMAVADGDAGLALLRREEGGGTRFCSIFLPFAWHRRTRAP